MMTRRLADATLPIAGRMSERRRLPRANALRSIIPLAAAIWLLPGAQALAAHPSVALSTPGESSAGVPITVSYTSAHLPRGTSLVLQHPGGPARLWRTTARLRIPRGSATLAPQPLGNYALRIAAISAHHKVIASRSAQLSVFGTVPLSALATPASSPATVGFERGTRVTATQAFPYTLSESESYGDTLSVAAARNDCRSVHLAVLVADRFQSGEQPNSYPPGYAGVVSVVRQSAAPVTITVGPTEILSLDTSLQFGQSWAIDFAPPVIPESFVQARSPEAYLEGSASCLSARGLGFNVG
jgi:hypothetical protein